MGEGEARHPQRGQRDATRPSDYQQQVLVAVHAIRVDPLDETSRLMLADLLEEHGREDVVERCCKPLREGKMVINSLDREAIKELGWARYSTIKVMSVEDYYIVSDLIQCVQHSPIVTLEQYQQLWELAYKHRDRFAKASIYRNGVQDCNDVIEEAERVHDDRLKELGERTEKLTSNSDKPIIGINPAEGMDWSVASIQHSPEQYHSGLRRYLALSGISDDLIEAEEQVE